MEKIGRKLSEIIETYGDIEVEERYIKKGAIVPIPVLYVPERHGQDAYTVIGGQVLKVVYSGQEYQRFYRTYEEAEQACKEERLYLKELEYFGERSKFIDWKDPNVLKYFISYDYTRGHPMVDSTCFFVPGVAYASNEVIVKDFIREYRQEIEECLVGGIQ